ncbi:unnamed protein product [Rhodiola kirilowii]
MSAMVSALTHVVSGQNPNNHQRPPYGVNSGAANVDISVGTFFEEPDFSSPYGSSKRSRVEQCNETDDKSRVRASMRMGIGSSTRPCSSSSSVAAGFGKYDVD